jgi:hypothetical protein
MSIREFFGNKWVKRGGIAVGVFIALDILAAIAILTAVYYGFYSP